MKNIIISDMYKKKTTATALIQERYTPPPQKPFRYRIIHLGYTVFMFDNTISSPAARPLLCLSPHIMYSIML